MDLLLRYHRTVILSYCYIPSSDVFRRLSPYFNYTSSWSFYIARTYIHITQQIIEATVAVVGGAAQSLEDAEPLGTQRATVRRQLSTQDPDVVHPEGTLSHFNERTEQTRGQKTAAISPHMWITEEVPHLSGSLWSTHTSMSTLQTKL